jgi:hypothetical protein
MVATLLLIAALGAFESTDKAQDTGGVQAMLRRDPASPEPGQRPQADALDEESPDVFLTKATLQQYLSRAVRKDWDGARRLTHPKTLGVIAALKRRTGGERHNLAPWANRDVQLKTFRFENARQVAPGVVLVQVSEDTYRTEEQGMSEGDPAVYLLFKSHGGFLLGDKKEGVALADVSSDSVKIGYPGYVDAQVQAQARRESGLHQGRHR